MSAMSVGDTIWLGFEHKATLRANNAIPAGPQSRSARARWSPSGGGYERHGLASSAFCGGVRWQPSTS